MRRLRSLFLAIGLSATSAQADDADPFIVVETPTGAMSVRPKVTLDEQLLSQRWSAYLDALFGLLDRDESGALEPAEVARVPLPELLRNQWHADFDNVPEGAIELKELDRSPRDGRVSREELADFYRRQGCGLLEVQTRTSDAAWADAEGRWLFAQLAADDVIDARSLATAYERLRSFDTDDDERLAEAELRMACRTATLEPRKKISTASIAHLADEPAGETIDLEVRLVRGEAPRRVFQGGRGRFVDLVVQQHGRNALWFLAAIGHGAADYDSACLTLTEQFNNDDLDRDSALGKEEIARSDMRASFDRILAVGDVNSNGQLELSELKGYLAVQAQAARNVVLVSASDLGSGLFRMLDADGDRALGLRELRHGWDRLRFLDKNENGHLAPEEIWRQYELTCSLGRAAPPAKPLPAPKTQDVPHWFQQMDRNGDGDVSRREFLGTRGKFDALDTDGDDLLSPAEVRTRGD